MFVNIKYLPIFRTEQFKNAGKYVPRKDISPTKLNMLEIV